MHMDVELRLGGLITVGGQEIALGKTFALLDGIARERSVRAAAERLGSSYRSAWGRVAALEEAFGRPLVVKTKGHGSALTPEGEALRAAIADALAAFEAPLAREQAALKLRLERLVGAPRPARLALSHDPVLAAALGGLSVEASVVGSREAVDRLVAGEADAAGFHGGVLDLADMPLVAARLEGAFEARPLFVREQGLMLTPGNPRGVRTLHDLARTGARFVNRQRGSGTRIWLERLLDEAGIAPARIAGFDDEEFTHQAVAAVVASGAAEAGMGVRAVAERFGLAFAPLGRETYFLAARPDRADLLDRIAAAAAEAVAGAPGYAPPSPPAGGDRSRAPASPGRA